MEREHRMVLLSEFGLDKLRATKSSGLQSALRSNHIKSCFQLATNVNRKSTIKRTYILYSFQYLFTLSRHSVGVISCRNLQTNGECTDKNRRFPLESKTSSKWCFSFATYVRNFGSIPITCLSSFISADGNTII
jgi:hypothetical protein